MGKSHNQATFCNHQVPTLPQIQVDVLNLQKLFQSSKYGDKHSNRKQASAQSRQKQPSYVKKYLSLSFAPR